MITHSTTVQSIRALPGHDLAGRRREQILAAATPAFATQGYAKMDVGELADALGIGKGTIYRYFPRKAELFLAAVDRAMQLMDRAVDTATGEEPDGLRRLEMGIEAYLEFFSEHREFVELMIQERAEFRDRRRPTYFQHRDVLIQKWQAMYAQLMAAGRIRDMPIDKVTDVVSHLAFGTMLSNFFAGREKSSRTQAIEIMDVLRNGILAPAGIDRRRVDP